MATAPPPASNSGSPKTIAILGAGITGLQTALSILSSPSLSESHSVVVIAQHLPGDESIDYTSPWAGGHWRSHAHSTPEEAELRAWDARTYQEWRRLLRPAGAGAGAGEGPARARPGALEKEIGLGVRESIMFWSEATSETAQPDGSGLWWHDAVSGFRVLGAHDIAAAAAAHAGGPEAVFSVRYETVCINVPRYLAYLRERVSAMGGEFVRAAVRADGGVEGVVEDVRRRLLAAAHVAGARGAELEALVLATGLSSRSYLPLSEASNLYPVRGQTVLVRGEASRAVTHLLPGGGIAYAIPRPGSGTTILGGTREVGNWDVEEDKGVTVKILESARGLVPELLVGGAGVDGNGEFEVVSVQVGRRPGRKGGPRVELEKERLSGVSIIYAYGHEGAGYQNSVGSAEKVVKLLAARLCEDC